MGSYREFYSANTTRGESAPDERWQHSGRMLELTDHEGIIASRAMEENMLDVLWVQGAISQRMHAAALRLLSDFVAADMMAHVSGSYNPARVSFGGFSFAHERSDAQEEAYNRWRKAVCAVGSLCSDVVISVACYDLRPDEAHLQLLQIGLAKLATWYGEQQGRKQRVSCDEG